MRTQLLDIAVNDKQLYDKVAAIEAKLLNPRLLIYDRNH
jgi:hypothetical protein